jgi:fructosamine-3-kinase
MLRKRLQQILGAKIEKARSLPVGFGLEGLEIRLQDGRHLAVKASDANRSGGTPGEFGLEIEAFMLRELARLSALPVPRVHYADSDLLIMAYLPHDSGAITTAVERDAAVLIADLHGVTAERHGYSRDTLIGPLPQPNPPSDSWIDFFCEHRLLYMAGLAHAAGRLPAGDVSRIERLAGRLDRYLLEPSAPSLLHGDLWGGNVLTDELGEPCLIDPAVYGGHREIDLAMMKLFGGFGPRVFAAYKEAFPLADGYRERVPLYQLYPLMVHVNLFGGGYLAQVEAALASLV